jgi:curved DNA-binding protein CbpA
MSADDPFAVLKIAPTCDLAAIKRAYFAELVQNPPHSAPEGFRRLRAAYETLSDPHTALLAFLRAPIDTDAELAHFAQEWGARVEQAARVGREQRLAARATQTFVDRIAKMTYAEMKGDVGR